MIITCPHCQTRYQVAFEAIGAAGRKVQCANCQRDWRQVPLPVEEDEAAMSEDALDDAFVQAANRAAEEAAEARGDPEDGAETSGQPVDPALQKKRQRAFSQRQSSMIAQLPMARLRRAARIGAACTLVGMIGFGFLGRTQVVEMFPSMAGVYESMGLGVNVVGLNFTDVRTQRTLRDGKEVLLVQAEIVNVALGRMPVPPVVLTLIDAQGKNLYQWSVRPLVRSLVPGKTASISTQLSLPPGNVAKVKLSFASGNSSSDAPTAAAPGNAPGDGAAPNEAGSASPKPAPSQEHG
ncbi:zinc-ribbon domain-containing protein [Devosia rhodophyticola]|uniref:Zinc-ribbon domain-containing protein n=1 Tax=Devosia rhodophyticola TaxID=3026423 RepID=A0ABY7YTN8_9HYPH|nr:zinc-ribbon domain-containing protein [Devosia rhodophyticola]WDR04621.1 zinc-ribbon domain-containing protein [Devosia rhodophyticola]